MFLLLYGSNGEHVSETYERLKAVCLPLVGKGPQLTPSDIDTFVSTINHFAKLPIDSNVDSAEKHKVRTVRAWKK